MIYCPFILSVTPSFFIKTLKYYIFPLILCCGSVNFDHLVYFLLCRDEDFH